MATHHLKTLPKYFEQVAIGNKNFELRRNDRNFKVRDVITLHEWDGVDTGRVIECVITYILSDFDALSPDYVILSIQVQNYKGLGSI